MAYKGANILILTLASTAIIMMRSMHVPITFGLTICAMVIKYILNDIIAQNVLQHPALLICLHCFC